MVIELNDLISGKKFLFAYSPFKMDALVFALPVSTVI